MTKTNKSDRKGSDRKAATKAAPSKPLSDAQLEAAKGGLSDIVITKPTDVSSTKPF